MGEVRRAWPAAGARGVVVGLKKEMKSWMMEMQMAATPVVGK